MVDFAPDFEIEEVIENSHPCLAGHFPGNPIVPAVVLLDMVVAAMERWRPGRQVTAVRLAKFLEPLRPGVAFRIALRTGSNDLTRFQCTVEGRIIAEGIIDALPIMVATDV